MKSRFLLLVAVSSGLMLGPALASTTSDLKKYCEADVKRLCPGVPMGGGKIIECLKQHEKSMSVGCAQALKKMQSG